MAQATNGKASSVGATLTQEQLVAMLQAEQAKNEALQAKLAAQQKQGVRIWVSDKGCICFGGVGRYPVALYYSQWQKLLANLDKLESFMVEHAGEYPTERTE